MLMVLYAQMCSFMAKYANLDFSDMRSVLILLFNDRVKDPNSDTRATVVSAIRHSLRTRCSLFSLLTSSLMVDGTWYVSIFWVIRVRGSSSLRLFAGLSCLR